MYLHWGRFIELKLKLMGSLGGLNAAESCEIGDGVQVVERLGSDNNDAIRSSGYVTNSHGVFWVDECQWYVSEFKPTSTINLLNNR